MEKQKEYEIRNYLKNKAEQNVKENLDMSFFENEFKLDSLVLYGLTILEKTYKEVSDKSIELGIDNMELLLLVNPLREATYWYIKEMLIRKKKFRLINKHLTINDNDTGEKYSKFVTELHDSLLRGRQIQLMRSSSLVKLEEIECNKFALMFPTVDDKYNKEMIYYYGMDDATKMENERKLIVETEQYLMDKTFSRILTFDRKEISKSINILDALKRNPDITYYNLCKKRIAIDINKIANQISSKVIKDKDEIISAIAVFYYLSRLCMQRYTLKNSTYQSDIEYYCILDKSELFAFSSKVNINKERMSEYINYFSMDFDFEEGSFSEFPLICIRDKVLWVPSSFVLNDFQFSIVNGHYYKKIPFYSRDETVSQSIVDYIKNEANKYSNIICECNYLYDEPKIKFNNDELKSDIDVALYDRDNNILLIIECKWKENVYRLRDDYNRIEDALKKIYIKQLDKHEYYLNISSEKIDRIFNYQIDFSKKINNLRVLYLFVDKRIQFHDNKNNRHAIPIFMLAYLFGKYNFDGKLNLDKFCDDIEGQESKINYKRIKFKEPVKVDDILIE